MLETVETGLNIEIFNHAPSEILKLLCVEVCFLSYLEDTLP